MSGIDLFCSDMDGTLIDATTWRPGARDFVEWLAAQGIRVAFCSSRPPGSIKRLAQDLPVTAASGYGGSEIWVRESTDPAAAWRLERTHGIHASVADTVRELALEAGVQAWDYLDDGTWVVSADSPEVEYERGVLGMEPTFVLPTEPTVRRKLQLASSTGIPDCLEDALRGRVAGITLARSHVKYLEVTAADGPQDKGIRDLSGLLGVPLARVAAMGDQGNDAGMLRAAGRAFVLEPLGLTSEFADVAVLGDDVYRQVMAALRG